MSLVFRITCEFLSALSSGPYLNFGEFGNGPNPMKKKPKPKFNALIFLYHFFNLLFANSSTKLSNYISNIISFSILDIRNGNKKSILIKI